MSLSLSVSSLSSGRVALSVYGSLICMAQKLTFTEMAIFKASRTALNMLTPCVSNKKRKGDYFHEVHIIFTRSRFLHRRLSRLLCRSLPVKRKEVIILQNFILGVSVFFFASALALCVYSGSLLNRSIHILSYSIDLIERINRDALVDVFRKEGTE